MRVESFSFGSIRIDGVTYEHDVIVEGGAVRKRKKKGSKRYREQFGHTPLTLEEDIPWECRRLVIGTGAHGALPVMEAVKREARKRGVELVVAPTAEAIRELERDPEGSNAVLHITC
jgi:hypothetical protein